MEIIPVIDLMNGHVVHAKRGERQHYQPIQSGLCRGSRPIDIVNALLRLYPFKRLYFADINAIQKNGDHADILTQLRDEHPNLDIWLDAGFSQSGSIEKWQRHGIQCVIGSESLASITAFQDICKTCPQAPVLSLDFRQTFIGPSGLDQTPTLWPDQIILMSLERVGSDLGPDFERLTHFSKLLKNTMLYAAGGVRYLDDLWQLKRMGMTGVLVASALHTGMITRETLLALATMRLSD